MKKQSKILLAVLATLVLGAIVFASKNPRLLQGKLSSDLDDKYSIEKTDSNITRAEFAKMVVENADLPISATCDAFTDVGKDTWFNQYVCTLKDKGIVLSYHDGSFKPYATMNRAEAAKIIHSVFNIEYSCVLPNLFSDIESGAWYYNYINQLGAYDFFNEDVAIGSDFMPSNLLTKATADKWFSRSDKLRRV